MKPFKFRYIPLFLLLTVFVGCSNSLNDGEQTGLPQTPPSGGGDPTDHPWRRSRIAWDRSSLVRIFQPGNYARVIELEKDELIAVSGGPNGVQVARSSDRGASWSEAVVVAPTQKDRITMSVPEIMKCQDGSLLLTYNPRPVQPNDDVTLKYGIRARISRDNGDTWSDEIFVFDAQHTDLNGCWEPFTLQLPSGEILLFFANENDYPDSNEQNISMCRSFDGGQTWTGRQIVSYRAGHRDGMPVALHLDERNEIIVAIEDNGYENHKNRMQPSIIRIGENWDGTTVLARDERREYALQEPLPAVDNAAAPYICKAATGEILLSYQGTQGRDVPMMSNGVKSTEKTQEMIVTVGDEAGRAFTNASAPFLLPLGPEAGDNSGFEGMWNSLASFSTGELFAVTSTNAYDYPKSGVYGMKGYLLNDITPESLSATIDGVLSECAGRTPSVVIGHELSSPVYGSVGRSGDNLYLGFRMSCDDATVFSDAGTLKDGFEITFASTDGTLRQSLSVPIKGNVTIDRQDALPDRFVYKRAVDATNELVFECLIPFAWLTDSGYGDTLAINVTACDSEPGGEIRTESITLTESENVNTWLNIYLK